MKAAAAAARRARGRQAESTKKGGGERERVVERHRMSVPINCIGRVYALSKSRLVLECVGVRFDF